MEELAKSKMEKKEFSLNLKVNEQNQLIIPNKNPVNGIDLEYITESGSPLVRMKKQLQKTIDSLPVTPKNLWKQACSGDEVTNNRWSEEWNSNLSKNDANYDFAKSSCMDFFGEESYKPVIIAGSGPSLKGNCKYLKETLFTQVNNKTNKKETKKLGGRKDIRIVSCLHNFSYFEDNDYMTEDDYYVNLDAGAITVTEISEGGVHGEEWYWKRSENRILITTVLASPELLQKWKGKIYFYKTGSHVVADYNKIVDPTSVPIFSVGGNVLGSCLYFAKAILGAGPIIFIGADFCFSYDHKFHSWQSQYDEKFMGVIPATDIFGNRVFTWPSYYNFKCFFEFMAAGGTGSNPQLFINATEGGIFGSYPEGNIRHIQQTSLKVVLHIFNMYKKMPELMENSKEQEIVLF